MAHDGGHEHADHGGGHGPPRHVVELLVVEVAEGQGLHVVPLEGEGCAGDIRAPQAGARRLPHVVDRVGTNPPCRKQCLRPTAKR